MYLGKIINGTADLVQVENGIEVTRRKAKRTEAELYALGYKKACFTPKENEDDTEVWHEYATCLIQEWVPAMQDEPETDEIPDAEALDIITGRAAI